MKERASISSSDKGPESSMERKCHEHQLSLFPKQPCKTINRGTHCVHESHVAHSGLVPEQRFLASKAHVFPLNQAVSTWHNPWISLGPQKAEFPPAVVYGQAEQTTVKYTEGNVLINLLHSPLLNSTLFQLGKELGEVKS